MFKTYDMPKDDRYRYFGEVLNQYGTVNIIFYIVFGIVFIFGIGLLIAAIMSADKRPKTITKIFDITLGLIMFSVCTVSSIYSVYSLNNNKQEVKETFDKNTKNMRYITYDLKGKVNSIDESVDVQQIRFDDGKDNYRVVLDNNVPISTGDDIEVKSNEKIPTSDDYNQKNLMNNTAKDTKITIVVNHDGTEHKNIREVKGEILHEDKIY